MRYLLIMLILALFAAGCASQTAETTPPQVVETEAPVPSDTPAPAESSATSTTEPSPTEEPPTPTSEPSATPTSGPEGVNAWIAYVSLDENLWIMNLESGESKAVTEDADPFQPNSGQDFITYCCAQWSSDGNLIAYRREVGTSVAQGYESSYSLWVYDLLTDESRMVLEEQLVLGYAWKPDEHLISYGLPIATEYFIGNKADYANGIWAVDVESGETYELVKPERDYALVDPQWSPDGRFLSFDEVQYMEGRGLFAYYDFDAEEYVAWDEVIGNYSWSPDGEWIAYDTLAYVSQGGERIWLSDRRGEEAQLFSPVFDPGYAFHPAFSPQGNRIAYMAAIGGPDTSEYSLMVQDIGSEEPVEMGKFEQVYELNWSSDGSRLIFAAGPVQNREVVEVVVDERASDILGKGAQPALQP